MAAHLVLRRNQYDLPEGSDLDVGITLTFLHNGKSGRKARERLFVNDHEMAKGTWNWGLDQTTLTYNSPTHEAILYLVDDGIHGNGTVWMKDGNTFNVKSAFAVPTYACKVGHDVGVSLTSDGKFVWDTTSTAWKDQVCHLFMQTCYFIY